MPIISKWVLAILLIIYTMICNAQPPCSGTLSNNALPDGDFGSGVSSILQSDPGLAPGYQYENNPPPEDGFYTVGSTTDFGSGAFPCWIITGDNSDDPDGYMMIVNATFSPGIFYENRVEVCENTSYVFQVDIINLIRTACVSNIRPNIDFLIDNEVQYQTGPIAQNETWTTYGFEFTTEEGQTEIALSLRNNAPGGAGNDLALDNIGFFHCGPIATVNQSSLACEGGLLELTANLSELNYDNPQFKWQESNDNEQNWTDINNSNTTNLIISEARPDRLYRIIVANTEGNLGQINCRTVSEVFMPNIIPAPETETTDLFCLNDNYIIGDTSINDPGNYRVRLKNDNGCDSLVILELEGLPFYEDTVAISICPGEEFNGIVIEDDTVIVQNFETIAGCDSILFFNIQIIDTENLEITGVRSVCQGETTLLSAQEGFNTYTWSTGDTARSVEVGPGTYTVEATTVNGCALTGQIEVSEVELSFEWTSTDQKCPNSDDAEVNVSAVDGGQAPYRLSVDGIVRAAIPANWSNLGAGNFELVVEDSNGCSETRSITIIPADPIQADIIMDANGDIDLGQDIGISINTNVVIDSIQWTTSEGGSFECDSCVQTIWRPGEEGRLVAEFFSSQGCRIIKDTMISISFSDEIYFPSAFSPNDDNINDFYFPGLTSSVKEVRLLIIYDRWGNELYRASQLLPGQDNLGWNGQIKDQRAEPGSYVYYAEIVFLNEDIKLFTGGFTLVR